MNDKDLILAIGIQELADELGMPYETVRNWQYRKIPYRVRLEHAQVWRRAERKLAKSVEQSAA